MNLIQQPAQTSICGQCCVAMITDKTLPEITNIMGETSNWPHDLRKAFKKLEWNMANKSLPEKNTGPPNKIAVCFVESETEGLHRKHWIVWNKSEWMDPLKGRLKELPVEYQKVSVYLVERQNANSF